VLQRCACARRSPSLAIGAIVIERPGDRLIRHSKFFDDAAVIDDEGVILRRRRPHTSADSLLVEHDRSRRAREHDGFNGWNVDAIAQEKAIHEDERAPLLQAEDRGLAVGFRVLVGQKLRADASSQEFLNQRRAVSLVAGEDQRALAARNSQPILKDVADQPRLRHQRAEFPRCVVPSR
jgi:hypothetical protein